MQVFETESDFRSALRAQTSVEVSDEIFDALVDGVISAEGSSTHDEDAFEGMNLRVGSWVLRDQDVPVVEMIAVIGAGIVAVAAPGALALTAIVTGLNAFAKLVWETWRKSTELSADEIAVLGLLELHGPMSEDALVAEGIKVRPDSSVEDFRKTVLSLTDIELGTGKIVSLIRKDASERWRIAA